MDTAASIVGKQRVAATLMATLLVSLGIIFALGMSLVDEAMEKIDLSPETRRFASELIFSKMTALAQTTVALLGATWALLIVSESLVRLGNLSSSLMFVVTNAFFVGSLLAYDRGYDFIASVIFDHGAFDIHAELVSFFLGWQRGFFLSGCLSLALLVLLWRKGQ